MKTYHPKYCPNCGKMNTLDPARPHKKCKFCGQTLYPWGSYPSNTSPNTDPDHDGDNDITNPDIEPTP